MNVFIINGGQTFAHSGGMFNNTLTGWTVEVMKEKGFAYRVTNINDAFDPLAEVENFKWADVIIYHTPIWWFQLPNGMKRYIDEVFTAGHDNGIYRNDGRSRKNPDVNYGTGGLMQGKRYMVTTSWNAPQTAFTLEGECGGRGRTLRLPQDEPVRGHDPDRGLPLSRFGEERHARAHSRVPQGVCRTHQSSNHLKTIEHYGI